MRHGPSPVMQTQGEFDAIALGRFRIQLLVLSNFKAVPDEVEEVENLVVARSRAAVLIDSPHPYRRQQDLLVLLAATANAATSRLVRSSYM